MVSASYTRQTDIYTCMYICNTIFIYTYIHVLYVLLVQFRSVIIVNCVLFTAGLTL